MKKLDTTTTLNKPRKYQLRILDTCRADYDDYDSEGFLDIKEATSWRECRVIFWALLKNLRTDCEKHQNWKAGVFIFDEKGNEIIGETTDNIGAIEYSDLSIPKLYNRKKTNHYE